MEQNETTVIKRNIARNITELRKAYPMTQAELAEKINYSDKAVSKWERGDGLPDVVVLYMLSGLYGVPMDYFVSDHSGEKIAVDMRSRRVSKTHVTIALVVSAALWFLATAAFVFSGIIIGSFSRLYLIFVGTIPVNAIILLVFNSIWGKRKYNIIIESVIVWSVLLFLYLSLLNYNLWAVFIIGIPLQIVLIFVDRLIVNIIADKSAK